MKHGRGIPAPAFAWFAALLFALHPVCVESVAWISEQKNTLSTVFALGATLAYLRFEARRDDPSLGNSMAAYAFATCLFVLALLTKTVTATVPAALLVIAWLRRGRLSWRRDAVPLLPWLAAGAFAGLFTAHFERELIGAQGADFSLGPIARAVLAGRVFWFYLAKLVWPANLSFIYPRWTIDPTQPAQWVPSIAAVTVLVLLVLAVMRGDRTPRTAPRTALAALLLFGGTLFPVLGFLNVFPFLFSYVADHFQYLASLPIFGLAAAGLLATRTNVASGVGLWAKPYRGIRFGVAAVIALTLGVLSFGQARIYRDSITLYQATLARNPSCWMAHNNLAIDLAAGGHIADAIPHLETAIKLAPEFAPAENNLGDDLVRLGRVAEALPHFERAVRLHAAYAVAHRNLGMALAMSNRTPEAIAHFARAVEIDPADGEAELDWAVALAETDQFAAARLHFTRAISLMPTSADAYAAYADALAGHRDFDAAVAHYRTALEIGPDSADLRRNLAAALRALGRVAEASAQDRAATALSGNTRP